MATAREVFAQIDDLDTLQKRWHRLLRKYHPDTSQDPVEQKRLTTLTQEINTAYTKRKEVLEDEAQSTFKVSHPYTQAPYRWETGHSPDGLRTEKAQYPGGLTFEEWIQQKMRGK